jgi:hypothetical protein
VNIGDYTLRHGHARRGKETSEYRSWRGMIERCENPRHIGFKYYGALGVKVCERWHNFEAFLADMGLKPTPKHTIDRWPNPNGDYEPGNCRWATQRQQRFSQRAHSESFRVLKAWEARSRISKARDDLTSQRFNRLIVLGYADTQGKRARWLCRCDCGAEKVISGKSLRNGGTQSCGCLSRELASQRATERNRRKP